MKLIVNTKTKKTEEIPVFKARFRDSVSFGPVFNEAIVKALDEDCVLVTVATKPYFNPLLQDCYLRDPWEDGGKWFCAYAVVNKPSSDINALYNTAIEEFIDSKAKALFYTNQDRMISFIGDSDLNTDKEARYMKEWRSQVWAVAKDELAVLLAQLEAEPHKPIPTPSEIIAKLPEWSIPDNY